MYGNTHHASDVIHRIDYRTRYINYYIKEQNTVGAIVNIDGGSGAANEASEVTYLTMGATMVTNAELQALLPTQPQILPPLPILPPVTTYQYPFNGLGIVFTPIPYTFDGSSNLYSPTETIPFPYPITSLATDAGILYVSTRSNVYSYTSNVITNLNITNASNITKLIVTGSTFYFLQGNSQIFQATATSPTIVIAGSTSGFADGTSAQFSTPLGFTLYGGYIYIADTGNSIIRKMSTTSPYIVSSIAGNIIPFNNPYPTDNVGNRDGNGVYGMSLLYHPSDITVSPTGILYITDTGNNTIRQLQDETLTTLAGVPGSSPIYDISPPGFINLPGAAGLWNAPQTLTYFNSSLYITEPANQAIRAYAI